jgi:putative ABC transport system permease protein
MELRPIVSALMRHKTGTFLVALQIAVTLAIIVNGLFIINQRVEKINRPYGIDVDTIIAVSVRGFGKDFDFGASLREDMELLRNLPDVVSATSINQIPLSGSGSSSGFRSVPDETTTSTPATIYRTDEYGLTTLATALIAGRDFYPEEVEYAVPDQPGRETPPVVIVTKALADKLYPDGDALGKPLYWPSMEPSTIVGIIGHMMGSWPDWNHINNSVFQPRTRNNFRYLIKTEPGTRDSMVPVIEEKLAELNRKRLIRSVTTHEDIVTRTYEADRAMANILIAIVVRGGPVFLDTNLWKISGSLLSV